MENVIVPVDFSDATSKVVEVAGELASPLKARLILLHVVEPMTEYVPIAASMDVLATPAPAMHPLDTQPLFERLERLAEPLRGKKGLAVTCIVRVGLAVDEILAQVQSHPCGLIVLGSHGHGALYHLFAGNVVTGVLKRAECPILVVPVHVGKKH